MADLHQITFTWPAGPSKVIVTGTFDNWEKTVQLDKSPKGFSKTLGVPWDSKIVYKYFVDGQWQIDPSSPKEYTDNRYMNNVYTTPPNPAAPSAPAATSPVTQEPEKATLVSEATDSVLASHGAPGIVSYVASGVGAAIANVTGYDPINSQQIRVPETPIAETAPATATAPASTKPANGLEPIHDEPVVLHLPSDTVKSQGTDPRGAPIPNAPEPYKEVNGTLPGELDHPRHSTAAHSSQVIPPADRHPETTVPAPAAPSEPAPATEEHPRHSTPAHPSEVVHKPEASATTTTTAVESAPKEAAAPKTPPSKGASLPRTSDVSPPTTPRKFSFQRSRGSVSGSIGSADSSPTKKKKRESIFEKIKDVFHHHDHHHDKKEKAHSP